MAKQHDTSGLDSVLDELRGKGVTLPRHGGRARKDIVEGYETNRQLLSATGRDLDRANLRLGRPITSANYDSPEVQDILKENAALARAMGQKRATGARMQRQSNIGFPSTGLGGDVYAAYPRFYDPLEYWDLSGLPWNVQDEGHRHKLHKWLRLYYATHYLVPLLVDIFTRFPLVGLEFECKDNALTEEYEDMFLGELDYEEFFVSLGREYWVAGEAFPLGSFDPNLAVWEHEELINPEDIAIENFPFLNSQQLKIKPPDYLKRIVQTKNPAKEWRQLQIGYPELIPYLQKGDQIPVSGVLLKQVGNKLNDWDDHGTPILLRGLRTLLHEEKLLASQDAIAERLYSPLILAKLGIMDMGDGMPPFIPGPEELEAVRDDFDIALASDFRLLVHHFGLEVTSVFGREQMPRLGDDFDRVERRLMQVFGVNPSLLSAGSATQPYASSALQAEFLNQILRTFQKVVKKHYESRAYVVAEARKHYDYYVKGGKRIEIMETIVEFDEEGNQTFKEVPKLLIPEMKFATLDMRDEATERSFLQSLRQMGVPIPDQDLMVGVSWKIKDKIRIYNEELKEKTISQQQAKFDTYYALTVKGLPIPTDLKMEVESVLQPQAGSGAPMAAGGMGGPNAPGAGGLGPTGTGTPGAENVVVPPPPAGLLGPGVPGGGPPVTAPIQGGPPGAVPEISNERRPGLTYNTNALRDRTSATYRESSRLGKFMEKHPELGVPFWDYVVDNSEGKDLDKLTTSKIEDLYKEWPAKRVEYEQNVAVELATRLALNAAAESATLSKQSSTENEEEWKLAYNQTLVTDEKGEPIKIVEELKKSPRIVLTELEKDKKKKYSIIDPEAEIIEGEAEEENESNNERSGSSEG